MAVAEARLAIAELEAIGGSLKDLAVRQDADRRRELVELRRRLSHQVAAIATLCDPLFITGDSTPVQRDYRNLLSRMRTAIALHQANWPAVKMNDDPAAYRVSVQAAADAQRAFVAWIGPALDQVERDGAGHRA